MHEDATYDMLGSASGFQMNPLSVHPPRTPHTSISAASAPSITYNSADIYTSTEENEEKPVDIEEEVVAFYTPCTYHGIGDCDSDCAQPGVSGI